MKAAEAARYPGRIEAFLDGQLSFDDLRLALASELYQAPERRAGCIAFLDELATIGRLTLQLRSALLDPVAGEAERPPAAFGDRLPPRGVLADLLDGAPPAAAVSLDEPGEDATVPLDPGPGLPRQSPLAAAATLPEMPYPTIEPVETASRGVAQDVEEAFLNDYLKGYGTARAGRGRNRAADQRLDTLLADWRGARFRREADRLVTGAEPARPAPAEDAPRERGRRVSVGSILKDRFVIESLLGRGGMGRVFRAIDRRMLEAENPSPYVALKVLNDEFAQRAQAFQALEREARKSQSLTHPNIINVFDVDRDDRTVYIVMEWLSGAPLSTVLRARGGVGLPPGHAKPIIAGMCAALAHAHAHGIVHSDFKPANIFVRDDGVVKVIDFGIARATSVPTGKTAADRFDAASLGGMTLPYASPEIIENGAADPRDDIYALGCVAYLMLQGDHPFARKSAVEARDEGLEPAPIAGLPPPAMAALRQALAFDRDSRTASAEEFQHALLGGLAVEEG